MTARPVILVTGATGAQGGSVARHLLARDRFHVRALSRRPDSEAARALAGQGAEVVAGDLSDRPSLRAAIAGCQGVFGVTNYWEHFEAELEHGRNLLYAVAGSEVEHFVFSTLRSAVELSGGTLKAPHLDQKAELTAAARELELPATFVDVAFYYENFLSFFPPRRGADGVLGFGFPQGTTPLAAVSVDDVGGIVAPIFERPDEFLGETVGVVGDELPAAEFARQMTIALGEEVRFQHVPREVFAAYGFPGAEDLADMFELNRTFMPSRVAEIDRGRELYPALQSFETWIGRNRDRFAELLAA